MKKAPRIKKRKKLFKEYTFISPERDSEESALHLLRTFEKQNCPKKDGWMKIDFILEQLPSGTWHVRARYAKYQK